MAGAALWRQGPDPRSIMGTNSETHTDLEPVSEDADIDVDAEADLDVDDGGCLQDALINNKCGGDPASNTGNNNNERCPMNGSLFQGSPTPSSSSSTLPWSSPPQVPESHRVDERVLNQQQQHSQHQGDAISNHLNFFDAPTPMSDLVPPQSPPQDSMIEHPIFVFWCVSCGAEASEDSASCPACGGIVQRQQRILEVPDEDVGTLSLASLRAALADVSAAEDLGASAVLLAQQGPDPGVASIHPKLAEDLVDLGVPPAVQRALVERGFQSLDQITAAAAAAPGDTSLAAQLGLTPAAEILLRRLRTAQDDLHTRKNPRKRSEEGHTNPRLAWRTPTDVLDTICMVDSDSDVNTSPELDASLATKRIRGLDTDSTTDEQDMLEETEPEPSQATAAFPGFAACQQSQFPRGLYV